MLIFVPNIRFLNSSQEGGTLADALYEESINLSLSKRILYRKCDEQTMSLLEREVSLLISCRHPSIISNLVEL